jgi:hypothetical protein
VTTFNCLNAIKAQSNLPTFTDAPPIRRAAQSFFICFLKEEANAGRLEVHDSMRAARQFLAMISDQLFWPAINRRVSKRRSVA